MEIMTIDAQRPQDVLATAISGWVLVVGSALSVLGMMHHPSASGHGMAAVHGLAGISGVANGVHGFLMVVLGALVFGLCGLTSRIGWSSPSARAAFIAYAIGAMAMIGAAVINGFAFSRMAGWFLAHGTTDPMLIDAIFAALGSISESWAQVGVGGQAFAIALWAFALRHHNRPLAVLGALVATLSFAGMVGAVALDVHGYLAIVIGQATWTIAAGAAMIKGKI
jgi:hypothetical protein